MAFCGLPLTFLHYIAFEGVEVSCQNIRSPVLMTCILCFEAIFGQVLDCYIVGILLQNIVGLSST